MPRLPLLVKGWRTDLPRTVLLLQAGNAFSWFGYGLILPFEIIYLHEYRGFSTSTAGFVLAAILAAGTIVSLPTGALLDHFRPKHVLIASNLASAIGYAGFAFVDRPWQAFACAVVGGVGVGAARTANATMVVTLIRPDQRPASFALERVALNLGLGLGGTTAGFLVASAQQVWSFQVLYLFDAITFVGLALVILVVVPGAPANSAGRTAGGLRAVLGDRRFVTVMAVNLVLVIVGYSFFANILAPFVKAHTSVGPGGIGVLFLFNTFFIVVVQLPVAQIVERLGRAQIFAMASAVFAIALLGVLAATLIHSPLAAAAVLCGVATVFALGECVHGVVVGPLAADFAPPHLLGRYISVYGLMVSGGFALGPAIGGVVLAASPDAVWWGGAIIASVIGGGFLLAGSHIPDGPLAEVAAPAAPATSST